MSVPLTIVRLELNEENPDATTYNLHLSRRMTEMETRALVGLLNSAGFHTPSPQATNPDAVILDHIHVSVIEGCKDKLKDIVAEAAHIADAQLRVMRTTEGEAAARFQDAKDRAAAMDWS
jgi:RIO-like serine/threonine protein kinase